MTTCTCTCHPRRRTRWLAILALAVGLVVPVADVEVAEAGTRGIVCNVSYDSGAYVKWRDGVTGTILTNLAPGKCSSAYSQSDADRWWVPAYRQVGYRCDNGALQHTGIRSYGYWTGACLGTNQTVSVNIWA
jgi:hypothetical protein